MEYFFIISVATSCILIGFIIAEHTERKKSLTQLAETEKRYSDFLTSAQKLHNDTVNGLTLLQDRLNAVEFKLGHNKK